MGTGVQIIAIVVKDITERLMKTLESVVAAKGQRQRHGGDCLCWSK